MSAIDFQDWLLSKYSDDAETDITSVPEPARTLMCVYLAHFPIGNGGYRFLFENDLSGDVSYQMVVESYRKVGLVEIAESIDELLGLFPGSTPQKSLEEREKVLEKYFEEEDEDGELIESFSPLVGKAETLYYKEYENIPRVLQNYYEKLTA